jgi:hypothetical protein
MGLGTAREFSEGGGPYPRKVPPRLLALFTEIAVCDGRGRTWTHLWPFRVLPRSDALTPLSPQPPATFRIWGTYNICGRVLPLPFRAAIAVLKGEKTCSAR